MTTPALTPGRVVRELFVSSRPVSWINTAFPFAAAYLLTTRQVDVTLIVGILFFLVPYNLAMYGVNDVFDYESDLRNPRKVSLFFVVFYSAPPLRLKERPFADSMTSSIHFFSPAVYGLVLAGAVWTPQLVVVLVAFALWGIASHAFGAVQDVEADRAADISSIATARGARWTVRFALVAYLLAGVAMLFTAWPGPLAAVLVIPYLVVCWPYRNVTDANSDGATAGWNRFLWLNQIAGFGTTMLLIWWWFLTA
ncbi:MAG: ubiA [Microbacterium sp.]|nr:ubiA [Microbacterium sp.]